VIWIIAACTHPRLGDCEATVDPAVATVLHVDWTTDATGGDAWVDYGTNGDRELATPTVAAEPGADGLEVHAFDLLGLPALTDVHWRGTTLGAGGNELTCTGTTRTDNLPPGLPSLTLESADADAIADSPRYLLGNSFGPDGAWTFIVDREAEWLWYRVAPDGMDYVEVLPTLDLDDQALWIGQYAKDHTQDLGAMVEVDLDGTELDQRRATGGHHVFTELPDGSLAYLSTDIRAWHDPAEGADVQVVGDRLVEQAPDGTERVVWSVWDWLPVTKGAEWDGNFYPQGHDWTHANALKYDAATDTYLLSMAHLRTIVEIDRPSGNPVRWFGPDVPIDGAIGVAAGSLEFSNQHDPGWLPDGHLMMFATDEAAQASGGVEYAVDEEAGVLREVWRGGFDQHLRTTFLGQSIRLANGHTIVNYAARGVVQELDADGVPVWDVRTSQGTWFAQVHPLDDLYAGR
jgi:hypothetical protein